MTHAHRRSDIPTLTHWVGGPAVDGHQRQRHSEVTEPGHRRGHRSAPAGLRRRRWTRRSPRPKAAFPGWRDTSLARRTQVAVRVPRAAQRPQGRARRDHHLRARQGALRRPGRGLARPGGRGVRLRHAAPAEGLDDRERLDRRRRALGAPAARRGRASSARSTSRPWSRCGSSRSRSRPATPSSSSRARRCRPRRSGWPSCGRRPACPTASSTSCNGDKEAVDALLTHPDVASDLVRRLHPDREVRLRDRHRRTASGCRPSAARRTTWSCCPTPTSTWPPTRRSTPASAPPASAAWPSPRSSPSARSPTTWWPRSPTAPRSCTPATAPAAATWARWSPPPHATGSSGYIDAGEAAGAKLVVDGRGVQPDADGERASSSGRRCSTRSTPRCRSTPTRSSGRCCSVVRVDTYDEAVDAGQRQPRTATAPRSSPTTAAPPAGSRTRSRSG